MPPVFASLRASLTAMLLFGVMAGWAQVPAWQAAISISQSGNSNSVVYESATDANGDLYLTGVFEGTVAFGSVSLTSGGFRTKDIFIARWNTAAKSFAWARRAGGTGNDYPLGLAVNGNSVYVTGQFYAAAAFGSKSVGSAGFGDMFITKLTQSATAADFTWTLSAGDIGDDRGIALAVNGPNVYVAGSFTGNVNFGGHPLIGPGTQQHPFLAKLIDEGPTASFAWVEQTGNLADGMANAVGVNGTNVYVAGFFLGSASFGSTTLTSAGGCDVFVAKLSDVGTSHRYVWAKQAGGAEYDGPNVLALCGTSVYVAGQFGQTARFGGTVLTSSSTNMYVTKLTDSGSSGSFEWTQQAGGVGQCVPWGLKANGPNVYVAGSFTGAVSMGSTQLGNAVSRDVFLAAFTDVGTSSNLAWVQTAGGPGSDEAYGLSIAGTAVVVAGYATPPAAFGSVAIAGAAGSAEVACFASLSDPTLTAAKSCEDKNDSGNTPPVIPNLPLVIPNIITPNGDGQNDWFRFRRAPGTVLNLVLYNRWGQEVYQRNGYVDEWNADGQPSGLYYYLVHNPVSGQRYRGWVEVVK